MRMSDTVRDGSAELAAVPCTVIRGGTSKGVFVREQDVPRDPAARDRFLLALMGSPDPRQIDGLGGADLLTTKVAIIGPPTRPDADLDYTFAQVSVTRPQVHFDINCGNISSAVGIYAVEKGLVSCREPVTRVRIHNRNTGTILLAEVPVGNGHALVEGDYAIDGVPGSGPAIAMDYRLTAGGATGALLPTGNRQDLIAVPDLGAIAVSVVDIANLCLMVRAESLHVSPDDIPGVPTADLLARVDHLQRFVARRLGIPEGGLTPIPIIVSPPHSFRSVVTQTEVTQDQVDIVSEVIGGQPLTLHKAFPGTASVTLAVASRIPGTVAYEACRRDPSGTVRIGHPSGRMEVGARVSDDGDTVTVNEASYHRTARLIMDGITYLRKAKL